LDYAFGDGSGGVDRTVASSTDMASNLRPIMAFLSYPETAFASTLGSSSKPDAVSKGLDYALGIRFGQSERQ
jgi:hypothetical protein